MLSVLTRVDGSDFNDVIRLTRSSNFHYMFICSEHTKNLIQPFIALQPTWMISVENSQIYLCPVCEYDKLDEPPYDSFGYPTYNMCPCCGTEFGYDDVTKKHSELRNAWIGNGMRWWSKNAQPPNNWDPEIQVGSVKNRTK